MYTSPPRLPLASFRNTFEVHWMIWQGPLRADHARPIALPSRHLPSAHWSPYAASDHPARDMVPQQIVSRRVRILPSTAPRAGALGWGEEAYFETFACCRPPPVVTRSRMHAISLRRSALTFEAIRATGADMSGRETVANKHSSPNSYWRNC